MDILITTPNGRPDKNDLVLQELVSTKAWKQALAHCEKRLKKGEKNDYLLVNKIHVLLHYSDEGRRIQGMQDFAELLSRKPSISDPDILLQLDDLFRATMGRISPRNDRLNQAWEMAAAERPKEQSLVESWLVSRLKRQDWKAAQKAAMVYMRNFPEKRRPFFLAIICNHLASKDVEATQPERELFKKMAHKLLSTAAAKVTDDDGLTNGISNINLKPTHPKGQAEPRALQSLREVLLLVDVFEAQGMLEEALVALDDPRTGTSSRFGRGSSPMALEKIRLQGICGRWKDQWQFCHDILVEAHPNNAGTPKTGIRSFGDDWQVWKGLVDASCKIRTKKNAIATEALINTYIQNTDQFTRHAHLAEAEYYARQSSELVSDKTCLYMACMANYHEYCFKTTCFKNLRYVHLLPMHQKAEFLCAIQSQAVQMQQAEDSVGMFSRLRWVTAEINALKQDYALVVSANCNSENTELIQEFIANCLRLYKISLALKEDIPVSDRRAGDDAAILAAMGCIRLYKNDEGRKDALLQCAVILEVLLIHSKHNYDALVIIVRVYLLLGAARKALEHYMQLDIKHIQYLTDSWIFFSRISTIHPHSFTRTDNRGRIRHVTPAQLLYNALSWTTRHDTQAKNAIDAYIEHDSYLSLLNEIEYAKTASECLPKWLLVCESRRISRLGYATPEDHVDVLLEAVDPDQLTDSRNTKQFPSYEAHGQSRFEEYIRPGPTPTANWLASELYILTLEEVMRGNEVLATPLNILQTLDEEGKDPEQDPQLEASKPELPKPEASTDDDAKSAEGTESDVFSNCTPAEYWRRKLGDQLDHTPVEQALSPFPHEMLLLTRAMDPFRSHSDHVFYNGQLDRFFDWLVESPPHVSMTADHPTVNALTFSTGFTVPDWYYFHEIFSVLDHARLVLSFLEFLVITNKGFGTYPDQRTLEKMAIGYRKLTAKLYGDTRIAAASFAHDLERPRAKELKKVCLNEKDVVGKALKSVVDEEWMDGLSVDLMDAWREGLDGVVMAGLDTGGKR